MKTHTEAKAAGLVVDSSCYPWIGYTGPRFQPTHLEHVLTGLEEELRDALQALVNRDVNSYSKALHLLGRLK